MPKPPELRLPVSLNRTDVLGEVDANGTDGLTAWGLYVRVAMIDMDTDGALRRKVLENRLGLTPDELDRIIDWMRDVCKCVGRPQILWIENGIVRHRLMTHDRRGGKREGAGRPKNQKNQKKPPSESNGTIGLGLGIGYSENGTGENRGECEGGNRAPPGDPWENRPAAGGLAGHPFDAAWSAWAEKQPESQHKARLEFDLAVRRLTDAGHEKPVTWLCDRIVAYAASAESRAKAESGCHPRLYSWLENRRYTEDEHSVWNKPQGKQSEAAKRDARIYQTPGGKRAKRL